MNITSLVAGSFVAAATAAAMAEAGLEFLGLGNPSTVSRGTILYYAQQQNALLTGQWVLVFAPGLAADQLPRPLCGCARAGPRADRRRRAGVDARCLAARRRPEAAP